MIFFTETFTRNGEFLVLPKNEPAFDPLTNKMGPRELQRIFDIRFTAGREHPAPFVFSEGFGL